MSNLKHNLEEISSTLVDKLDKVRTQKSRAADTLERIFYLIEKETSPEKICKEMQKNTHIKLNVEDILSYNKLYKASHKSVILTKKQTKDLFRNQEKINTDLLEA